MEYITVGLTILTLIASAYLYSEEEQKQRDEQKELLAYYSPKGKRLITVQSYTRRV